MKHKTDRRAGPRPASSSGTDLQAAFGAQVGQVARRWRALVDARLKEFGLTEATWRPLLRLSKFATPPRQTDLAESLSIEGPSLVRLLDTLERDGYILRCADSDRRTKTIRLTPRGETLQRKIAAVVADTRSRVLAGVADRRLAAALQVLEEVERSIRALGASKESQAGAPPRRARRKD
ncbi:MAG TPA: MarR family transcriptional regulator [Candidatus Angelobacter sp.]|nr:MarR family transcriptional regulator [Candidatus Angelobacter sp.]